MNFFLDVLLYGAAVFALVYFIYIQFFSRHERLRRLNKGQKRRFERREGERGDRRKARDGSPAGDDQRKEPRRDRDR